MLALQIQALTNLAHKNIDTDIEALQLVGSEIY